MKTTTQSTGDSTTSSLGKKCGEEWENLDGKQYTVKDGFAESYCRK